ncbi:hypothetical protein METP3_00373 [Methanosarcinales archaeon]|nr:hypothetical protein METP3_00373 [Methanosarcinales archaeon]
MSEMIRAAAKNKKPEAKRENKVSKMQKTGPSQSISTPAEQILYLQRTIGNQAVGRLIKSGALQAKLMIGQPGDIYEQEADRIAQRVMKMPGPKVSNEKNVSKPAPNNSIRRRCPGCKKGTKIGKEEEEEKLQKKEASGSQEEPVFKISDLQQKLINSKGSGRTLTEDTRYSFESALGADFSNVNIHTGTDAVEMNKELGAQAFTHGSDIYFNAGKYDPTSSSGKQLLAHELMHTVQQGGSALLSRKQTGKTDGEYLKSGAPNVQAAWYNFSIPFTDYEFDPSIEGIKTAGNLAVGKAKEGAVWVKDRVVEGVEWIFDRISDLVNAGIDWLTNKFNEIKEFATSSFDDIKNALGNTLAGLTSPMTLVKNAFAIMDAGALGAAWNALSAGANAVWRTVKAVVDGILTVGSGIWNTVSGYVTSLFDTVGSLLDSRIFRLLPDSLQSAARYLYNTIRSLWESIRDFWTDFWKRLTSFIHDLLASIENFVKQIISYAINKVIAIVKTLKEVYDFVTLFVNDPEAVIGPIIDKVAGKIESEAPGKAKEVAQQKMNEAVSKGQASTSAGGIIQRKPDGKIVRSTATRDEVNDALDIKLSDKWEELKAIGLRKMLWDTVVNMFWPPATIRAIGHEFYELWNTDWANAVDSLFLPRNIFDDFGGFFHDLWSNFLILLDFPLALWRRLNNILMLLMGYVTIILVLVGFVGGGIAGGGAFSVPAAFAGAWAGLQLSAALGYGLFISFILAESSSALKAFLDLYTARQTKKEKDLDYLQIAASSIGMGIAIIIAIIFFLLSRFASAVVAAIKGPKTPRALPPGTPPTSDTPPETQPPGKKPPGNEPVEPRVVPGKLSLIQEIGATQQRAANLLARIGNLIRGDRLALEARAQTIEQRLTQMQERANAAESARQVERLQSELDQVKRDLAEIEADPLVKLGLRGEALESIETLERLKKDPVGEVNQVAKKNHYNAARREAAGEVVQRRADGRPFDHIRDLQESYNALDRVRRILEAEQRAPPAGMTERGLEVLLNKFAETQAILSRLKGFLDQIGHGPPYPPFHEWPPGA